MKNIPLALTLLFSLLFTIGCTQPQTTTPEADGLSTIKVGYIPIADSAQLYAGIEQGFFAEQGIKLELIR